MFSTKEYSKNYYQKNREKIIARVKEYHLSHREDRLKKLREYGKAHYAKNRDLKNKKAREIRVEQRLELISVVSGGKNKCQKCGFSDIRALQIDHVDGGGTIERQTISSTRPKKFLAHVLSNKEKYQVLCANCNWIKRYEKNENRKQK